MPDASEITAFPLVNPDRIEPRQYQLNLLKSAQKGNTLLVLPTGLGKTVVALLLASRKLEEAPAKRGRGGVQVLMMAPTKPLVEQHYAFFRSALKGAHGPDEKGDGPSVGQMTGEVPPQERELLWKTCDVVIATPQVAKNDLAAQRLSLGQLRLMVLDEAHRATGDYAYASLAKSYLDDSAGKGHILGLTASPGGNARDILGVCQTLGITQIDVRTEEDLDVAPYVHAIQVDWIDVDIPSDYKIIASKVRRALDREVRPLQEAGLVKRGNYVSMRDLLDARAGISKLLDRTPYKNRGPIWGLSTAQSKAMKLNHALEYIETQGREVFLTYMQRLLDESKSKGGSRNVRRLANDPDLIEAYGLAQKSTATHPKVDAASKLVARALQADPGARIILFAHFRETAEVLVQRLEKVPDAKPVRFVGQATKGADIGLSQKEQVALIQDFSAGKYNVLVATSVAEEGLDIPEVDHVIFYEPVPSEIRTIQRRGRTGRRREGRVEVLVAKKTRDEAFRRASAAREVTMREELKRLRSNLKLPIEVLDGPAPPAAAGGGRLEDFGGAPKDDGEPAPPPEKASKAQEDLPDNAPSIEMDDRELRTNLAQALRERGVRAVPKRLEVGDFSIGGRIGVERKTRKDFAASIADGRLFEQARQLSHAYQRPVLILEGNPGDDAVMVAPQAIEGAVAALFVDLGVAVYPTGSQDGTADLLAGFAKQDARAPKTEGAKRRVSKTGMTPKEHQRFVLEGLPGVSSAMAGKLLQHFGTLRALAQSSVDEIAAVPGVGRALAERIYDVFHAAYPADG